jgi:tRNA (adenine22-N1)-methyltransferase
VRLPLAAYRLSERLQIVFNNLNPGQDVWDFCCDHGYLGGAAYKSQNYSDVYFVDQVDSIMNHLKTRFEKFVYDENSKSRAYFLCQSCENISRPVTGSVSITGVGGLTIFEILNALNKNHFLKAKRLILGPHRDNEKLLKFIAEDVALNKYTLTKQLMVTEGTRERLIYVFDLADLI